nr:GATA zinc finger domain-containing protein 16-like [Chelonoidis abingdonii]
MKVLYVAAFLIGLLSLESTRAAPLKKQLWSVGSGSVKTDEVGDGSFNDISKNNQFWSVDSGILKTSEVGDSSFDDNSKNNQFFWLHGNSNVANGNIGNNNGNNNYNG